MEGNKGVKVVQYDDAAFKLKTWLASTNHNLKIFAKPCFDCQTTVPEFLRPLITFSDKCRAEKSTCSTFFTSLVRTTVSSACAIGRCNRGMLPK